MSIVNTAFNNYPYAWYMRLVLVLLRLRGQELSEPVLLWARQPMAFFGFLLINRALDGESLPLNKTLRILIRTRVSQLNTCQFCIDLNTSRALDRGVSKEKLQVLTGSFNSSFYGEDEKVALAYAEAVTTQGNVEDSAILEKLRHTFDDDSIVALTAIIAHQNMSAKFNAALRALPKEGCMASYGYTPSD